MGQVSHDHYYVPESTNWPIIGSVGMATLLGGFAAVLNGSSTGKMVMIAGVAIMLVMLFGWFGQVIRETQRGTYSKWEDKSFRLGMSWFIFSEVMFFAAFFGALFYARMLAVPWLLGEGDGASTHQYLWNTFNEAWPTNGPGITEKLHTVPAWGLPALNTLILLSSGVTVTWAHHALKNNNRRGLIIGLLLTIILGFTFVALQVHEYGDAFEHGLSLRSGIYGSTFFMLTGFHGLHVTIGAIMLTVMLLRAIKGHFTPENHFGFEAAAWYWHFVDVVWLFLFIFVYWL